MIKNILASIFFVLMLSGLAFMSMSNTVGATSMIFADSQNSACKGAAFVTGGDCDPATGSAVQKIIKAITSIFAWFLGLLAIFLIILGGFKYVTSGGDSGKVSSAKNTILFAIVGLVVAAMAQPLVNFVIGFFTKN